jgi:hypothetical protein
MGCKFIQTRPQSRFFFKVSLSRNVITLQQLLNYKHTLKYSVEPFRITKESVGQQNILCIMVKIRSTNL